MKLEHRHLRGMQKINYFGINSSLNMETAVPFSDSGDDSDDLPSFEDRVRQLMTSKTQVVKKIPSPNKIVTPVHSISDNENSNPEEICDDSDSRDTVVLSREKSMSPMSSLVNAPSCDNNRNIKPSFKRNELQFHSISGSDDSDSRDTVVLSREKSMSPMSSLVNAPGCNNNRDIKSSVKRNELQFHSISDSDDSDSRDTVPLSREKCVSPLLNIPEKSVYDANKKCFDFSSDEESIPELTQNVKTRKKKKTSEAEIEKDLKKKVKLEKKKEKQIIKALKASEKEILKSQKPEECIKNMKIVLDHNILCLDGCQSALNLLDLNNLKYCIERKKFENSVNWYRTVINISTSDDQILKEEKEVLESTVVVIIPNQQFLKMLHVFSQKTKGKTITDVSFEEFIVSIRSLYSECDITCVTVGFHKFMRNIKEEGNFELKTIAKEIHKNATEEALIELQLQSPVNFNFLENMTDLGNYLWQFTKAIAESPQRREKQMQKTLALSWYADIDSNCPVKLSKDGSTFIKLWKQQIQQFLNVGPEMAEAIVSRFPTPRSLFKVYKRCVTAKDAESILQDIVVRRNYGPLGTQKRIGPELAYKLYLFFTSTDGNKLLKR